MTSAAESPRLAVISLTKRYGHVRALDDVSLAVRGADVVGVIGPNGAGKTTLFECVAGLVPRDAGEVRVDGVSLAVGAHAPEIFYLPDGIAPWPAETVAWALDFTAGFFGGVEARLSEVVRRFDLTALLGRPMGALSKGQRKRALLAVAALMPQPILLIDEPFDGLDLRQMRDMAAALREEAEGGRTLLLSIHQISDAARVCDRFVLLSGGRVKGDGTVDELADAAARRGAGRSRDLEEVFLALT